MLRGRLAESLAWVGDAELDAGYRLSAACRFLRSLAVMPGLDRRLLLLVRCGVPNALLQSLRALRRAVTAKTTGRIGRRVAGVTADR